MYKLNYLKNKKIAFLGFGIENQALIKYLLKKKVKCEITVCDSRSKEKLGEKYLALDKKSAVNWQLGKNYNKHLDKFDILFRSPGWPIFCPGVQAALEQGFQPATLQGNFKTEGRPQVRNLAAAAAGAGFLTRDFAGMFSTEGQPQAGSLAAAKFKQTILSSPMKLFFDLCPTKNIIGVTGTKGKGTTSSLIYAILKKAKKRAWLGGNIGTAPFEFIDKIRQNDWVVLELSSFQLEDMEKSPRIAVITNFHKEHLVPADPNNPNYHKTLKAYWGAKMNLIKWQNKSDYAIINSKIQDTRYKIQKNSKFQIPKLKSRLIWFAKSDLASMLIGEHNKENIAAAVEAAKIVGVGGAVIKKVVAGFKGLEHRLEFVREINGVKYYNDSFATTPESSITALKSFNQPIILLAGGADKGADFKALAKEIKKRVKFVVLLNGKATPRLKKTLQNIGYENKRMKIARNIGAAVRTAGNNAVQGDIILLSTACASFGMFKNYKERGKLFKDGTQKKQSPG